MDNVFLIQFLQGEIDALEALNVQKRQTSKECFSESAKEFCEGGIAARDTIINNYKARIAQAEKEMTDAG